MSWDKETINMSAVDGTISVLENLGTPYTLTILGKIKGREFNDDISKYDEEGNPNFETREYAMRQLEYKDVVLLEKIIRNSDCDIDDYIISYEFKKGYEPKDWEIEERQNND